MDANLVMEPQTEKDGDKGEKDFWLKVHKMVQDTATRSEAMLMALDRLQYVIRSCIGNVKRTCATEGVYISEEREEDLAQSLKLAVVEKLPQYEPYHNGKFTSFTTYVYTTFINRCSDVKRGGDGMGDGLSDYAVKNGAKPGTYSIDEEILNQQSATYKFFEQNAVASAESIVMDRTVDPAFARFCNYEMGRPMQSRTRDYEMWRQMSGILEGRHRVLDVDDLEQLFLVQEEPCDMSGR